MPLPTSHPEPRPPGSASAGPRAARRATAFAALAPLSPRQRAPAGAADLLPRTRLRPTELQYHRHRQGMARRYLFLRSSSVLSVFLLLLDLPTASPFSAPASSAMTGAATTLGSGALRGLVQKASVDSQKHSLDLSGIVWLEHLNLVVGDMDVAKKFYADFLGLSRDDNPKHFNLGQQQFHLAANDDPPQRVTGSIGLTVPSLQRIRERVAVAQSELEGTMFSILHDGEDAMTVSCPWGNTYHLYDIATDDHHGYTDAAGHSPQKMVKLHAEGGAYGPHRMAVRGKPGIRFVEIACRAGTVRSIANFYENMLRCQVTRTTAAFSPNQAQESGVEVALVCMGPGMHMAFVENDQLSADVMEQMEGVHACVYVPSFRQTYDALKERGLIWTNPRFTHLDSCDTWEEAYASRTFRFRDILDCETGEKVLEFEHETRPMLHGQYMKVPPYDPN